MGEQGCYQSTMLRSMAFFRSNRRKTVERSISNWKRWSLAVGVQLSDAVSGIRLLVFFTAISIPIFHLSCSPCPFFTLFFPLVSVTGAFLPLRMLFFTEFFAFLFFPSTFRSLPPFPAFHLFQMLFFTSILPSIISFLNLQLSISNSAYTLRCSPCLFVAFSR